MVRYHQHDAIAANYPYGPPLRAVPPGVCDYCGRFCSGLHEAGDETAPGSLCYFCNIGYFRHRGLWVFVWCWKCGGVKQLCEWCHLRGVHAWVREDDDYNVT